MQRLLQGSLGEAVRAAIAAHGLDPKTATDDELESAFLRPDALVMQLTPPPGDLIPEREFHRRPRYRFTHTAADGGEDGQDAVVEIA